MNDAEDVRDNEELEVELIVSVAAVVELSASKDDSDDASVVTIIADILVVLLIIRGNSLQLVDLNRTADPVWFKIMKTAYWCL